MRSDTPAYLLGLALFVTAITACFPTLAVTDIEFAEQDYRIDSFRQIDHEYIEQAKQRINDRARRSLGSSFRGQAEYDIPLLQRMLDEKIVAADELELLQAMGVVLGEVFRSRYPIDWIRYSDIDGTSRALQLRHEAHFIFPITMISRRASVGAAVDVQAIYERALSALTKAYER